jgi:pilus assembly protein CpaE
MSCPTLGQWLYLNKPAWLRKEIQVTSRSIRVVIITAPDQLDQEWINRLEREPDIESVERVGLLNVGLDLVSQSQPDIVIFDRSIEQTESGVRRIFTSLPNTLCIGVVAQADMATLRRLVAAGARDILARPVVFSELITSIRNAMLTEQDRRSRTVTSSEGGASRARGKLVVVTSPKGGVGTTTVATNLAVGLRQISNTKIVLADFGLQFGDVGVLMNIWARNTMQELFANPDDIDDTMLNGVLQQHNSGVQVLLAPNTPEAAGELDQQTLTIIPDRLLERFNYVVCDTWSFLDEITETLLAQADEVLVVTTPEVPSLKNTKSFLEHIEAQNLVRGRITLVLNRFPSVNGISLQDVQKHLRHPVGANIPSEGQFVTHSVNRGIPVVSSHPQTWVAQSILKLAAYVTGDEVSTLSLMHTPTKTAKPKERTEGNTSWNRSSIMRIVRGDS